MWVYIWLFKVVSVCFVVQTLCDVAYHICFTFVWFQHIERFMCNLSAKYLKQTYL